ncbi:MAG: fusA [Acidimicrobiia bacterium]|nr:fusA [Acidimicrobiia bacterium]
MTSSPHSEPPLRAAATPTDRIRNVALIGHNGAGKTTLAECLLVKSGAIKRGGRIEDGNTACDTEPEEVKRQQSLSLAVVPFEWKGHRINLIDAPGYADFTGEAEAALDVADLAVLVVSAVEGVEAQTETLWRLAADRGLPRLVFVNKLDRDHASFDRTVAQLRERLGGGFELLELPLGEEQQFRGVADLLTESAFVYESGNRAPTTMPADLAQREHQEHDHLVEDIVAGNDELLEQFLDGHPPSVPELEQTLAHEVDLDRIFPVLCGSAIKGIAVDLLADFLVDLGPAPTDRPARIVEAGDQLAEVLPDPAGPPLVMVFKTIADPFVGQLSMFRVLSGTIRSDDRLVNTHTGAEERMHGLFRAFGKEQRPVELLVAGDIGAVTKLTNTHTGDTLAPKHQPVRIPKRVRPAPAYQLAIVARTQSDEDKLSTALGRLLEEDPSLSVTQPEATHQTVLGGAGDVHLHVALERMARKFGVEVGTEPVKIAYVETIAGPAAAEGRYKKQSGGHGQFGVAMVEVEPLPRGGGFEFVDQIVGGAIPRQFIPAVEKGIVEALNTAGLKGFPVVDVRVRCVDGKHHAVDSSEMSFKMAGSLGFKEALAKAGTVVLEPLSLVVITVPTAFQGEALGDINARRGRVQATEALGNGTSEITAVIPDAELQRYALDLRSISHGRGSFTRVHDHYDVVPAPVAHQLGAAAR